MTSNIYPDHYAAADIIADVIWTDEGTLRGTVTEAAQALKDSGRLMPDLPEPDSDGRLWPEHDFTYAHVQSPKFTGTGNVIIARGASSLALTREEALELASLLTAAALEEA